MPHPCPHHCPPEGGGIPWALLGVLALVALGAAVAGPVVHAAEIALQIVLITVGVLVGLAMVTAAAVIALKVRHHHLASQCRCLSAANYRSAGWQPWVHDAGYASVDRVI
jgi:hypothetical protein